MAWEQLAAIQRQNREQKQKELQEPPVACPNDGSVLDVHKDGRRNCPMGDYRWDGAR